MIRETQVGACPTEQSVKVGTIDLGHRHHIGSIYRYMSAERYYDIIEKGVLSLSHITLWEDPFEGFLFRALADAVGDDPSKAYVYDAFKYYYGQSWTINGEESDETWRAHGTRGTVVRVKTSVDKLCRFLSGTTTGNPCGRISDGDIKMGLVKYAKSKDDFDRLLKEGKIIEAFNGTEDERLKLFFVKRMEFNSEAEFRVIVHATEDSIDRKRDTDGRFLKIEGEPNELIEDVLVDPCMGRREYEQLICRTRHFCPHIFPHKSDLFDWPKINLVGLVGDKHFTGGLEHSFWTKLQSQYPNDALNLSDRKPPHRGYWQVNYHGNDFFFYFTTTEARIEFYIPSCDLSANKNKYKELLNHRLELESAAGKLEWDELLGKKANKVKKILPNVSIRDEKCWDKVVEWMCSEMPKLVQAITSVHEGIDVKD